VMLPQVMPGQDADAIWSPTFLANFGVVSGHAPVPNPCGISLARVSADGHGMTFPPVRFAAC